MSGREQVFFIDGKRRRMRVDVFVLGHDNTVLVGLSNGFLDVPGGGIDIGETPIQAGMRELAEEAGWTAVDFFPIEVQDTGLFNGIEKAFQDWGWDEEQTLAVGCRAVKFNPTEQYGIEKDHLHFNLVPITTVIEDIEKQLLTDCPERVKVFLRYRLKVLWKILSIRSNEPVWFNW